MRKYIEKMFKGSKEEFLKLSIINLKANNKMFVITANPETIMIANEDNKFSNIFLKKATHVIADGIGVVKGGKKIGIPFKERIPGIEIAGELLLEGNHLEKTAYFLGGKQEVLTKFLEVCKSKYPNLKVVGSSNGYIKNKEKIMKDILLKEPDIILVGLGIPNQEKLIAKYYDKAVKGIFIGVGGTMDVLSGTLKRAPKLFIKLHLEWLYRLLKEPKRIKRFYNSNVKFLFKLKK